MKNQTFTGFVWGSIAPILLYYFLSVFLPILLGAFFPQLLQENQAMWLLTFTNLLMFPLFYRMYQKDFPWRAGSHVKWRTFGWKDALLVMAGAVCVSRGVNMLIGITPLPYLFPEYETVSETIFGCSLLSQVAASVVSASLLEEVLVRGLIYNRMKMATYNRKWSMIISAFLFGIFHGNVVQGVYAFVLGLFFVQVYEAYQSLVPAVLAHMAANAVSILLGQLPWISRVYENAACYYLITVFFLAAGAYLWKKVRIFK